VNKDINLADVRAFVLIAKAGSFTAVADQLCCSRSHLSKQLVQLESALGLKLIIRTTRSQRLTEQGKLFFEQCSHALNNIDSAVAQAIDGANAMQGTININCIGGHIGEEIIAPLVNGFIRQHPDIKVNLDFSSQRVDLVAGDFDIVFRMGQLEDSNLVARKLLDLAIVTVASPDYLQRKPGLTDPKQLKQHQCITGSLRQWNYIQISQPNNSVDVLVDGVFECKNGRAMIVSAVAGNGIVRVPVLYCAKEIANGTLIPVFKDWQVPPSPFYVVYLQDKFQPSRLKAFVRFINDNIAHYATGA